MPDRKPYTPPPPADTALQKATHIGPGDPHHPMRPLDPPLSVDPITPILRALADPLGVGQDNTAGSIAGIPAGAPGAELKSLGKPIHELLDLILHPTTAASKTGLPSRLRFTNVARDGSMEFHGATKAAPRFQSSVEEVNQMLKSGMVDVQQPPDSIVERIRKKIAAALP